MNKDKLSALIKSSKPVIDVLKEAIEFKDLQNNRIYINKAFHEMAKRKKKEFVIDESAIFSDDIKIGTVSVYHDMSEFHCLKNEMSKLNKKLRKVEEKCSFQDIIGRDQELLKVIKTARIAAATPATIMLRGESGTGKELFANAIHNGSKRRGEKFVKINCSSIPEELLESELFGYKEGAFTGAKRGGKVGLFKEADGGTLFLDEIGDITHKMQVKLLRVLQEKEIMPVGSTEPENIDVRIICATNKPLEELKNKGEFREDLYYRLNVFPIFIPPLRERKSDIGLISMHILEKYNEFYDRSVTEIDDAAIELLKTKEWMGNVRELENVISRALINAERNTEVLNRSDMEFALSGRKDEMKTFSSKCHVDISDGLTEAVETFERLYIEEAINKCEGDKNKAANILKIPLRTLYYKCKKLGI